MEFLELNFTFGEVRGEKLVRGIFSPILNRIKTINCVHIAKTYSKLQDSFKDRFPNKLLINITINVKLRYNYLL